MSLNLDYLKSDRIGLDKKENYLIFYHSDLELIWIGLDSLIAYVQRLEGLGLIRSDLEIKVGLILPASNCARLNI